MNSRIFLQGIMVITFCIIVLCIMLCLAETRQQNMLVAVGFVGIGIFTVFWYFMTTRLCIDCGQFSSLDPDGRCQCCHIYHNEQQRRSYEGRAL